MRQRWAAAFAGLALVVAAGGGLAGGVPFGVLLGRCLLAAALFAALGVAAALVVERWLPEVLRTASAPSASEQEEEAPGGQVDIVLPEENPHAAEVSEDVEFAEAVGPVEALEEATEAEGIDEAPPEVPALEEELAEAPEAGPAEEADAEEGGPAAESAEELDTLPSLDGLDMGSAAAAPTSTRPRSRRGSPADALASDPLQAARAVRTWLRRDDEG